MTKNTIREEVIKKMIDQADREIEQNKILSDFYTILSSEQDEETGAKSLLKKQQVDSTLAFNIRFNEYLKSL
jgi:hypothetical protein